MIEPTIVSRRVRRETLRQARIAAYMNNHAEACRLFASIGIPYVVEVQIYQERT